MLDHIPQVLLHHRQSQISDAAAASLYFLCWQVSCHGKRFASRRSRRDPRPEFERCLAQIQAGTGTELDQFLIAWFETYQFFAVSPAVPVALAAWLRGSWRLRLMFRIPSPREVLGMQVDGIRPVTLIADPERMTRPVLTKANGFAFLVHDLAHAHKFYADPDLHAAQCRLFVRLQDGLDRGLFEPFADDGVFAVKFDYLISDMNTHIVHGLLYLRAILVEASLRRELKRPGEDVSKSAWDQICGILQWLAPDVVLPTSAR